MGLIKAAIFRFQGAISQKRFDIKPMSQVVTHIKSYWFLIGTNGQNAHTITVTE